MSDDTIRITTDIAEVYVEDGIFFINYTVTEMFVPALKLHNLAIKDAFGHLFPLPTVVSVPPNTKQASKEVREYSASPENMSSMSCMAVIMSSVFMRTITNLFMKFVKIPVPMQLFSDREAAIVWAKTFIK